VQCDVTGDLGPACNAAGYWDRLLLGQGHLYCPGEKDRHPTCSSCSPGVCPIAGRPAWCTAPFDPEGTLASFPCVFTCFLGLHFSHILAALRAEHEDKLLRQWGATAAALFVSGMVVNAAGWEYNKQLWSPSYLLLNAGMCGGALLFVYYVVDVRGFYQPFLPFKWMGMNAILIYTMAAADVFANACDVFYTVAANGSKTHLTQDIFEWFNSWIADPKQATLVMILCKICFWFVAAGLLHRKGYYWKI
jgi:heparan-alpha-glucosaminide N-acetyltransferase